jgi:uncharacterized repeat protein (TIGR03803 family)
VGTQLLEKRGLQNKVMNNKQIIMYSTSGPIFRAAKLRAAIIRGAIFLAVLSAALTAVLPVQAQTENVLYNFGGTPDGANPYSGVITNGGNFYGTTYNGGMNGDGAVYEITPNSNGTGTENILYSFCWETNCADGQNPYFTSLVFDKEGNLYGTTYNGGANGYGVVFELTPNLTGPWAETVLYSFAGTPDAANPINGLIWDAAGNLYGTSYNGGVGDIGTVFELSPNGHGGWSEQVVASLAEIDAGLTINAAGDIFGTTNNTVFELVPNGAGGYESPKTLYTFPSTEVRGETPEGTLTLDSSGNIYGTTRAGGKVGNGTVYKLTLGTKGTYTESIIYSFGGNGTTPYGGVVFDPAGNLYGTTRFGGKNDTGVVYELDLTNTGAYSERVRVPFTGENGAAPYDTLLYSQGYLYGTTFSGGANGYGTVFVVNPNATDTTTTVASSANPSTEGESVTFTATVTPAPPDGDVVVFEPLGQSTTTNGVATYTTSALAVGTTRVRAVFEGDLNFITSMSEWYSQVVKK